MASSTIFKSIIVVLVLSFVLSSTQAISPVANSPEASSKGETLFCVDNGYCDRGIPNGCIDFCNARHTGGGGYCKQVNPIHYVCCCKDDQ
ncbi:uncharacterized protein A4U43_C01F7910 [Asparagus officinalis]|uniref:Knottin scorpion toxin-like domain-containing protein n=1 Tax=Asparagus officinalis TaxID=4686 RepID=A0A5P1FRI9_ASPOF|nr:uncharacterized protein A4U43_C01F7910 [Asparagus officinalis]